MKIYGNEKTSLNLSDKAYSVYIDSDPLRIIEEDDGSYTITGIIYRRGLTEAQVNATLEAFSDEIES